MPWKDKTVKKLREEFVNEAQHTRNFSALCREFGVTRRTGYKWLDRASETDSLVDRSHAPNSIPHKTSPEVEQLILEFRQENPGWGAKKLRQALLNLGYTDLPSVKTFNNILSRNGCISHEESMKHRPYCRFQMDDCNKMWQTDFKGEFRMADGNYCYPLDIIDDHSRYAIKIVPRLSTANLVLPVFREAFYEYGMPDSVLSDNGAQFAGFRQGYTQFEKWLMDHDVLPIHGRIKHPQTQGKIERFHRSMKSELLEHYTMKNIEDAQRKFSEWRVKYNTERPHEALGMKCPAQVYSSSTKTYIDRITPFEYGGEYHVIKVNSWGYVRFAHYQVYLSETMIDEHVEFRPNPDEDSFFACYRNFRIAEFSTADGKLLNRHISRL